jgi:hypothetical protein
MKTYTVKKKMMKAIKDLEKPDIYTINTKINKIEISSLRIRCMMLSFLKIIYRWRGQQGLWSLMLGQLRQVHKMRPKQQFISFYKITVIRSILKMSIIANWQAKMFLKFAIWTKNGSLFHILTAFIRNCSDTIT